MFSFFKKSRINTWNPFALAASEWAKKYNDTCASPDTKQQHFFSFSYMSYWRLSHGNFSKLRYKCFEHSLAEATLSGEKIKK